MNNNGLPIEYTACEVYEGYTIAVANGVYSAFKDGKRVPLGGRKTREAMRRTIDRF